MDHIFSLSRRPSKGNNLLRQIFAERYITLLTFTNINLIFLYSLDHSLICSVSSTNVIAFSSETDIDDNSSRSWGSHVYVADLNTPWFVHK